MPFYEYRKDYNSALIRGEDLTPRPEIAREHILKYSHADKSLLDIGCGSAYKTASYVDHYQHVFGLEPSPDLLATAKNWLNGSQVTNLHLLGGIAENLPFQDQSLNVVSSILSWWDAAEVSRVLKKKGIFIIERLGPDDKIAFTALFGKDEAGSRGTCVDTNFKEIKQHVCTLLSPYFQHIAFYESRWETAYVKEGLWMLLTNTKTTVRNFSPDKDKIIFDNAIQQLEKNKRIVLTQNRITVVAQL